LFKRFLKITNIYHVIAPLICLALVTPANATEAVDKVEFPDILILGDSQITFGAGTAYLDFFQNLKKYCAPNPQQSKTLKKLKPGSVGVIGVRSSSLPSWTARKGKAKGAVCDVDPKWNVNAGAYGIINKTKKPYVQIGKGKQYQFCKKNLSPFEALLRPDYYNPDLLILSFLGNSTKQWAQQPKTALKDVQKTIAQLPADLPCVFITTAPPYTKKSVDLRLKAQKNLRAAFRKTGNRCSFVDGLNAKTIAANLGNKRHFKHKKLGAVKDPFHPNKKGAKKFFSLEKNDICTAVFTQLASSVKNSAPSQ